MLVKVGRKYALSVVSGLIPINSSAEGKLLPFITILWRRITVMEKNYFDINSISKSARCLCNVEHTKTIMLLSDVFALQNV